MVTTASFRSAATAASRPRATKMTRLCLSHLIVISGSNIAFLAGALVAALGCVLPKRRAAVAAAPLVLLYVLLVGADPPALRAGVMGLLALGAIFFGRRGTAYVSLCAAGMIMLALNPLILWDIGFQLSFMTSLGLIVFNGPLGSAVLVALRFRLPIDVAKRWTRLLDGTLIVTVAAQAAVLPLILAYFGRLSPVSLLANCLVLPVQPAILAGGIAALLAGAVWLPLGQAIGTLPWLLLSYTASVVRVAATVPFASVDIGRVGPLFVAGYYVLLALAFGFPWIARALRRYPDLRSASRWSLAFVLPACLAALAWRAQPDGRLHIAFVPAEDGEAALVLAPDGRTAWMWDGHGDGKALVKATQRGGWVRGKPDLVLADCARNPWEGGRCIDPANLAAGAVVALTGEVRLVRVSPADPPALLLTYGRFRTLLPATLSPDVEETFEPLSGVSVLKTAAPETGAWPSLEYLAAAQPQLVLWPLETSYPPAVTRYLANQARTARVEAQGTTEVLSDGERFWVLRHSAAAPR
ncbi:MAG: ComEC/Rec2 family competence protein [Nitrososphaerales archaeon]